MRIMRARLRDAFAIHLLMLALGWRTMVAAPDACASLYTLSKPGVSVVSALPVPADPSAGLPAFCEVQVSLTPVAGSRIGAIYRLPANWNGKVLGIGGGGSA